MTEIPDFLRVANRDKPMAKADKPLVFSFTMMNTYDEICPHQMAHRYVWKTIPFVETPQMKWGTEVHTAFEYRIGGGKPLPPDMRKWEGFASCFDAYKPQAEIKLGVTKDGRACDFFDPYVWFRGKIDCSIVNGASGYIADFKTGNSKYERAFELETGAVLLQAKHPAMRQIKGRYAWLAEDRWGEEHDLSNTSRTWAKMQAIAEQITQDKASGQFEKRKSGLCGHCPVKACEWNRNANA